MGRPLGDRGRVPLWLSEWAKRWRQGGGACPHDVLCWWFLCFCFCFLFFSSEYVGDWYWIWSQGDVVRTLWWCRRRCINSYWSLFSLHTMIRVPQIKKLGILTDLRVGTTEERPSQRPCSHKLLDQAAEYPSFLDKDFRVPVSSRYNTWELVSPSLFFAFTRMDFLPPKTNSN